MRNEAKEHYVQRLADAEEFLESASVNFVDRRFKAAVDNAADAAIAANDAFTIWSIQKVATSDHLEAIKLHKEAGSRIHENKSFLLSSLLDMRHIKAYTPAVASKADAELALRYSEAFVGWVKEKIEEDKGMHQA